MVHPKNEHFELTLFNLMLLQTDIIFFCSWNTKGDTVFLRTVQELFSIPHSLKNKSWKLLKMYSLLGHPRCRLACFFIGIYLEKCNIKSLGHQWIHCTAGCRQNKSPNSWYKRHNNPQVIHRSPINQLIKCTANVQVWWTIILTSVEHFQCTKGLD